MIRRVRSWLQYRAEKRMLERNPYDYVRWVLGMPDATDEELDAAAEGMADAMRQSSLTVEEAEAAFAQISFLSVEPTDSR